MTKITYEEAANIVEAVIGDQTEVQFATSQVSNGDVAVVLRANGGIEIMSTIPDNPDRANLQSLGIRGLFALSLMQLAMNPDFMSEVVASQNNSMTIGGLTTTVM